MRRFLLFIIILLSLTAIALAVYTYQLYSNLALAQPPTQESEAQIASASEITAEGTIIPRQQATLAFGTGGRVTGVRVKEGDTVVQGQVLAMVDDMPLQNQVKQAEAALLLAQKQLDQLRAGASPAQRQAAEDAVTAAQAKYDDSKAVGGSAQKAAAASLSETKSAVARLNPSAEELAVAQAQVHQAETALNAANTALDQAKIKAPFAGSIGQVNVHGGDFFSPGLPAIIMGDLSALRVETNDVSDMDIGRLQTGQKVTITVDALGESVFHGTVASISPMATESRGYKVFRVYVDLSEGTAAGLRWGMTAKVHISPEQPAAPLPGTPAVVVFALYAYLRRSSND